MISMLFHEAIIATKGPVVTAVILSIGFWMIFATNLKIVLCLGQETLDYLINLDRNRLFSIEKTIVFALAS